MKLNELIDAFYTNYLIACKMRGVEFIDFTKREQALILSKTVSDLQKSFNIIEVNTSKTSISGTNSYALTNTFMNPKVVSYGGNILVKKSTEWINSQTMQQGIPTYYTIQYLTSIPNLLLYPTPASSGDTIVIVSNLDMQIYSPSASSNDFGTFDGEVFSGNLNLPTVYDQAVLYGMLSQIFPDIKAQYEQEKILLKVKQYNGVKFEYKLGT